MTIGGKNISEDTYRYFYFNYKASDPSLTEEQLHQKVTDTLCLDVALTLLAKNHDVGLNKEEKESVDAYIKSAKEQYGGKKAFNKAMSENHCTEKVLKHLYSQQLLENKLREYMYMEMNNIIKSDDATLEADIKENFMAAKQVLIRKNYENDDENKALAEHILEKALAGEDFDFLVGEYSQDTSASAGYVYHFTYGEMVEGFENAVADTPVGRICEYVAESEIGFHVIMRVPLDEEYVDSHFEEFRDAYKARCFNEIRQTLVKSFTIEKTKEFDSINFDE